MDVPLQGGTNINVKSITPTVSTHLVADAVHNNLPTLVDINDDNLLWNIDGGNVSTMGHIASANGTVNDDG